MPRVVVYAKERRLLTTFEQLLFIFFFVCVRAYRLNPSVQAHHLLRRRVTVLLTCILCARARRKRKRVRTEIPNCHEAVLADEYTHLLCFRFSRGEVLEILSALQIPEVFRTPCRHVFTGEKALYALLAKLSHLGTPALLLPALGFQREEQISLAYLVILYHLRPLLERVTDMRNCTPYFKRSAQVLEGRGCPHGCFALLDGKIFQISKQEGFYSEFQSGHKFVCGVTYLGITLANGLLAGFQGPIIGSRHDSFVFSETDTYTRLQQAREKLRYACETSLHPTPSPYSLPPSLGLTLITNPLHSSHYRSECDLGAGFFTNTVCIL